MYCSHINSSFLFQQHPRCLLFLLKFIASYSLILLHINTYVYVNAASWVYLLLIKMHNCLMLTIYNWLTYLTHLSTSVVQTNVTTNAFWGSYQKNSLEGYPYCHTQYPHSTLGNQTRYWPNSLIAVWVTLLWEGGIMRTGSWKWTGTSGQRPKELCTSFSIQEWWSSCLLEH